MKETQPILKPLMRVRATQISIISAYPTSLSILKQTQVVVLLFNSKAAKYYGTKILLRQLRLRRRTK